MCAGWPGSCTVRAHYAAGCCTFAGAGLLLRARVCDRLRRRGPAGECTAWRGAVRGADRGEFGGGSGLSAAIPIVGANMVRPLAVSDGSGLSGKAQPRQLDGRTMFAPTDCTREVSGRSKILSPTRCSGSLLAEGAKGLPQAISSAVTSSLSVCGCVVFFRIVGAVLLAVLPLPPTAVSAALEVSAGCADFAALGGAAALYGCCACLSVLGVSVWAQLRLFAGTAYRPRLLVFSRAVHLCTFAAARQGVRSCCPAALRYAVHWPPASCRFSVCRRTPRRRGLSFLCAALYKARQSLYNTFIINDSIFCGLRVSLMFKRPITAHILPRRVLIACTAPPPPTPK